MKRTLIFSAFLLWLVAVWFILRLLTEAAFGGEYAWIYPTFFISWFLTNLFVATIRGEFTK